MTALKKDTRKRPLIRLQLADSSEGHHASEIVSYWMKLRMATFHITRAIRMYYALQVGDTQLLREYFPLLPVGVSAPAPQLTIVDTQGDHEPALRTVQRSDDEDVDDFMDSLGL